MKSPLLKRNDMQTEATVQREGGNRAERRAKKYARTSARELLFNLQVILVHWRDMLARVERGAEYNQPSEIGQQVPAQVFLMERIQEINETQSWAKRAKKINRDALAGRVRGHRQKLDTFTKAMLNTKKKEC